jgi:hypothetical protein
MKILYLTLVISLCVVLPLHADSVDDAIAAKFYPAALDEQWNATHAAGRTPQRIATTLRVDLTKSGNMDYLAIAYSNGTTGTFCVVKGAAPDTAVLLAQSNDPLFGGDGLPVIEAVDVDNDGVPELAIEYVRESWLYKWTNGTLVLFGPSRMSKFGETSNLGTIAFADLDGDGKLEILEVMQSDTAPYLVFSLDASGKFVRQANPAIFVDRFERADGAPVAEIRGFRAVPGSYVLRIVNGDQTKQSVVTAGEVKLNGATIAGPNDFKKAARTLTVPVTLAEENTLSVELRSTPGSLLSIAIIRQ